MKSIPSSFHRHRTTLFHRALGRLAWALGVAGLLATVSEASAAQTPPELMSYQGYLVDSNGTPLGNTTATNYTVVFRIYSSATAQANEQVLWSESQNVTVTAGQFSVILGEGNRVDGPNPKPSISTVLSGATADERYVEITVKLDGSTDTKLSPRLRLLPSPYAFLASQANIANVAYELQSSGGAPVIKVVNGKVQFPGVIGDTLSFGDWVKDVKLALFQSGSETYGMGVLPTADFQFQLGAKNGKRFVFLGGTNQETLMTIGADKAVVMPGSLNVSTNITAGGIVSAGSISSSGALSAGSITTAGALNAGSMTTGGEISMGNGTGRNRIGLYKTSNETYGMGVTSDGQFRFGLGAENGQGFTFEVNESKNPLTPPKSLVTITKDGRVGVGTTSPSYPLQVMGRTDINHGFVYYAALGGVPAYGSRPAETVPYSIYSQHRILAAEYNIASDSRIKQMLNQSSGSQDLATIESLEVRDYRMADYIGEGTEKRKGFIAQQVQQVVPEAVHVSRRFIPDVYTNAFVSGYVAERNELCLDLPKSFSWKKGDKVQLITDEGRFEVVVKQISGDRSVVLEGCPKRPGKVFIFGREVDDFLSVDYDRIFTTGISAIQELNRRVQAQATRLSELESKVSELDGLRAEVASLRRKAAEADKVNASWETRFKALESLVLAGSREAESKSESRSRLAQVESR